MIKNIIKYYMLFIILLIIIFLSWNMYNYNDIKKVKTRNIDNYMSLNGLEYIELNVGDLYVDEGVNIVDLYSGLNVVTEGHVDANKPGIYKIKYILKINNLSIKYKYRMVKVVDNVAPRLVLNGEEKTTVNLGKEYKDAGCKVTDNSSEDLSYKIKMESNIDVNKEGEYFVKYSVCDLSSNCTTISRKVIVKKSVTTSIKRAITQVAIIEKGTENKEVLDLNKNSNTVTALSFTSTGINIKGYVKNSNGSYNVKLCSSSCLNFNMNSIDSHYYSGNINLSNLSNGTYAMKIVSSTEMDIINELDEFSRINRAKVENKLVTFNYLNNKVSLKIEDFSYQYDILIDPGHGGSDSGAVNSHITEKELNLTQSLYEKQRYEQHGLKVKLIREDDTYGIMMASSSESRVRRRAYAIGYYGSVSKNIYSNHHNSISNDYFSGWEIIVPAKSTPSEISVPLTVASYWDNNYNVTDTHTRFYTRNYDTGTILNKRSGAVYNVKNWYAVIRIPYELFGVNNSLYEGCYLSNESDFNWYYTKGNWKKMTELKIKAYVEKLGKTYIPVGV